MRVLGIEIAGTEIRWLIVEGSSKEGEIQYLPHPKVKFPQAGHTPAENYKVLLHLLADTFRSNMLDQVAVIRADQNSGVERAKIECIVELACAEVNTPCTLIHVNSVASAKARQFAATVGRSVASSFGGGRDICPQYLERAFYCAWKCFHG